MTEQEQTKWPFDLNNLLIHVTDMISYLQIVENTKILNIHLFQKLNKKQSKINALFVVRRGKSRIVFRKAL